MNLSLGGRGTRKPKEARLGNDSGAFSPIRAALLFLVILLIAIVGFVGLAELSRNGPSRTSRQSSC